MTNEINPKRIYQFLSTFEVNGQGWEDVVDGYGNGKDDGVVIKSEFADFINDNFNWNGETDKQKKDLINEFWDSIDTNVSATAISGTKLKNLNAIDSKELEAMNDELEAFVALNDFLKNVEAPTFLKATKAQWKIMITDLLSNEVANWLDGNRSEDINKFIERMFPAAQNASTAKCSVLEHKTLMNNTILAKYSEYDIENDETLSKIIENYIYTVGVESQDQKAIFDKVESILKAYFATANLCEETDTNLADYDYAPVSTDSMNGIQKEVIKKNLNNQLSTKYDAIFENLFPEATFDTETKAEILNNLKGIIANAATAFLGRLTFGDFEKTLSVSLENKTAITDTELIFNPLDYITEDIKTQLINKYNKPTDDDNNVNTDDNGNITPEVDPEEAERQKRAEAAGEIAGKIDDIKSTYLTSIIGSKSDIHTEFSIDISDLKGDNIIFQEKDTAWVYEALKSAIRFGILGELIQDEDGNLTGSGEGLIQALGGEDALNRLIQAAWIQTYNEFDSSRSHPTSVFISKVFENFEAILKSIQAQPELINIYTMHTSYADKTLVSGLVHYDGASAKIISYGGGTNVDSNGVVHLTGQDDQYYQVTMNEVQKRLVNKYSTLDKNLIISIFRDAQVKALSICMDKNELPDMPGGCGNGSPEVMQQVKDSDGIIRNIFAGRDNRDKDGSEICMSELVQLTLYFFDKLLYKHLSGV